MARKGLVYSTDGGKICPSCGEEQKNCSCRKSSGSPCDGVVRISRQTKGRKGAGVTIITGIPLDGAALKKCAKELKQRCGSGGTVKAGVLEIQGDHREILQELLELKGYKVKLSGG